MPESRTETHDVWFFALDDPGLSHWEKDVSITITDGLIQPLESRSRRWSFSHTYRETTAEGDHDSLVFVPRKRKTEGSSELP